MPAPKIFPAIIITFAAVLTIATAATALAPRLTVEAPHYDLLFADFYFEGHSRITFSVEKKKLYIRLRHVDEAEGDFWKTSLPGLYVFNSRTQSLRQISFQVPADKTPPEKTMLPELQDIVLDTNRTAPDGYTFDDSEYYEGSGFIPFLSGGKRKPVIRKDGRVIELLGNSSGKFNNPHFLGWILTP